MSNNEHSVLQRDDASSLREVWLQSFAKVTVIGTLYDENGICLFKGKSPKKWIEDFKIVPRDKDQLLASDLQALWLELLQKYQTAASFHSYLSLAEKALESQLESIELEFIKAETAKYKPGGEFWLEDLRKSSVRVPGNEALLIQAKTHTFEMRSALVRLKSEVAFFSNIMAMLETQRRCLKDYSEVFKIENFRAASFS